MKFCENPDVLTVMMYVKNVIKLIFNVLQIVKRKERKILEKPLKGLLPV